MVWPGRARGPQRKRAFDEALEEAGFDPDGELIDEPSLNGPAVGDFYDIAVAPDDYMAASSLVRAYEDEADPEEVYARPRGRPMRLASSREPGGARSLGGRARARAAMFRSPLSPGRGFGRGMGGSRRGHGRGERRDRSSLEEDQTGMSYRAYFIL